MNEHTPVAITEAQAAEVVAGFQRGALDELDLVGIAQDWREWLAGSETEIATELRQATTTPADRVGTYLVTIQQTELREVTVEADSTEEAFAEVRAGNFEDSTFITVDDLFPVAAEEQDPPITVEELRCWLAEDLGLLERTRSGRRRYLAADESDRPAIAAEDGVRNLTDFNDRIVRLRSNVEGYDRRLEDGSSQ